MKNLEEIKKAVDEGKTVYWKTMNYLVKKSFRDYLVVCQSNKSAFGLFFESDEGEVLNGRLEDYYMI